MTIRAGRREIRLLIVCTLASLLFCPAASARTSPCKVPNEQMLSIIKAEHDRQENVGLAVAVWAGGKLVFEQGYGWADRERRIPFKPATRGAVASITKAFTGLALLKAVEQGKIDLDAPIQRYVPNFPVKPELVITPRRLAYHLTGIRHWGSEREDVLFKRHWNDVNEPLPYFMNDPLIKGAGTKYQYSSNDYNLLAAAIENATGVKFETYVHDQVIAPLDLRDTGFDDIRSAEWRRVAPRYSITQPFGDRHELGKMVRVADYDYSFNQGGGNMSSTVRDLLKLGRAMLQPGFLSARSYAALDNPIPINGVDSDGATIGWYVSREGIERLFNITGAQPGAQAALYVWPRKRIVAAAIANSWGKDAISTHLVMRSLYQMGSLCYSGVLPPDALGK